MSQPQRQFSAFGVEIAKADADVGPDIGGDARRVRARRGTYRITAMDTPRVRLLRAAKPYAALGAVTAGAGALVAHDRAQERKTVAKLSSGQAMALVGGAGLGGVALGAEVGRRSMNRRGAGISPTDPYLHPYRTQYKTESVSWERAHHRKLKSAAKLDARAAAAPDAAKGKYVRRAERARDYANASAYNAHTFHRAGQVGIRRAAKEAGEPDRTRTYKLPDRVAGRVSKADRRINPAVAQWSGRLPKHSTQAAAVREAARRPKPLPPGPAIRAGLRLTSLAKAGLPNDNRQAEMARSRRKAGLGVAGAGYLLGSRAKDVAPGAADLLTRSAKKIGPELHAERLARKSARIARLSGRGGAALVGAGLLAAGEGAVTDLRSRDAFARTHQQVRDRVRKSAFGVDHELAKAFDSERSRHDRQALYAGGATGGAVVAGTGAVRSGLTARTAGKAAAGAAAQAESGHRTVQNAMRFMEQNRGKRTVANIRAAADLHEQAVRHGQRAVQMAGKAKKLSRMSRGSGLAAAALGATAAGLHNHDRRRGGRSYGY